jgi:hypothetical protein
MFLLDLLAYRTPRQDPNVKCRYVAPALATLLPLNAGYQETRVLVAYSGIQECANSQCTQHDDRKRLNFSVFTKTSRPKNSAFLSQNEFMSFARFLQHRGSTSLHINQAVYAIKMLCSL